MSPTGKAKSNGNGHKRTVDWSIISEDDREYRMVPVEVWNAEARVQTLNAKELTDLIEVGGDGIGFKLTALCLIDTDGMQLFRGPDERTIEIIDPDSRTLEKPTVSPSLTAAVERVKQKNPKAINELSKALITLNSITLTTPEAGAVADDVKNDSGETATDALPTVSP